MFTNEPVFMMGLIQSFIMGLLALVVAFGVAVSVDQAAAILGVVSVGLSLLFSWFTRSKVAPMSHVARLNY